MNAGVLLAVVAVGLAGVAPGGGQPETDVLATSAGDLKITFIGHGSLMFAFGDKIIHVDPYRKLTDYGSQPKADLILITHSHPDHLDPAAIPVLQTRKTVVVLAADCAGKVAGGVAMTNGEVRVMQGIKIEAVPAYNLVNKRADGKPFHPRGEGNGYILTFGDRRVYVAGDTENTPEMKALKEIDVAFLPMNLPYTMTPEMVADAAKAIRPKILYPYHYGETAPAKLVDLLKDTPEVEVRVRRMK